MTIIIGAHMSIADGIMNSLEQTVAMEANALQIFGGSPRTSKRKKNYPNNYLKKCNQYIKDNKLYIVIHSAYIVNIAKPVRENLSALESVKIDMELVAQLGNEFGVVVHIGKMLKQNEEEAMKNMFDSIKWIIQNTPQNSYLILENPAGQGTEMLHNLKDMVDFYMDIPKIYRKRVRVCIDTCHLFAAGQDAENQEEFLKSLKKNLKLLRENCDVSCFHLNDSKSALGSRVDRHEDLGYGEIDKKILKTVIRYANKNSVPMILETPGNHKSIEQQIDMVRKWTKKQKKK